jgi:hypothetical protein
MRFKRPNVKIPDDYPDDLKKVIKLVDDLAFYRTTKDDGGLAGQRGSNCGSRSRICPSVRQVSWWRIGELD